MTRDRNRLRPFLRAASGGGGGPEPLLARHWSLQVIGSGLQNHAAMAQLVLTFAGGASYTLTATETGAGAVANLSDGAQTTKWETTAGFTDARIETDLGLGADDTLTAVSVQQTDEGDAVAAHPAGFRIRYSTEAAPAVDEDWIDYCVLLTQVSGVSAALVEYAINADCQNGVDYYNTAQLRWGVVVEDAASSPAMAELEWQDAAGTRIGTVSSHITKSAALVPANLYDENAGTETDFESQAHPQLLATEFTAAIAPRSLQLVGSSTAVDSWTDIWVIAGPDDGCLQIITELALTWSSGGEVIDIDVRKPKWVRDNAIYHNEAGDATASSWADTVSSNDAVQATAANQPTIGTAWANFTNSGGTREWMRALIPAPAPTGQSLLHIFRRPSGDTNWDGTADDATSVGASETILGADDGGSKVLDLFDGFLIDGENDVYLDGSGWGTDPTTDDLTAGSWVAVLGRGSSSGTVTDVNLAVFGDGGADVDIAETLILDTTDITKKGIWKQMQKYAVRVIEAVKAA